MKRLIIVGALVLGTTLTGLFDAALAQPVDYDDASGANGDCTASGPPSDHMVVCSDLRPGQGRAVTEDGTPAKEITPTPAPAPEEATSPETTDTAAASATDQDADNAPDELEPGLGLDPTNPDTDADNVADGDEINIYGTDPLTADSDGDGATDGAELFASHTDPAIWDDFSAAAADAPAETP
jgi:hypothetical protein